MGKLKFLWKAICEAFNVYTAYSILSALGVATLISSALIAFLGNLAKAPLFAQILLFIGILCFSLVGVSLVGAWAWRYFKWSPKENVQIKESSQTTEEIRPGTFATKEELGGAYLKDRHFYIKDFVGVMKGRTFENCHIYGPAIVGFLGTALITQCRWTHGGASWEMEDMLYEIKTSRRRCIGAIPIRDCNFIGCVFIEIGIVGPPEGLEKFRAGIKSGQDIPRKS